MLCCVRCDTCKTNNEPPLPEWGHNALMSSRAEDREYAPSLEGYPNIRQAATILRVSPSTLSRRGDLETYARGERDRVLPASEVLRLGVIYRRRSLNDVAFDLVMIASTERRGTIEEEIETFFERSAVRHDQLVGLLENLEVARALLPADLYTQLQAALAEGEHRGDEAIGYQPSPADQSAR